MAVVVLVVVLLAGAVAWLSSQGGETSGSDTPSTAQAGSDTPSTAQAGSDTPSTAPVSSDTTAASSAGVPADWVTYTDPKVGYRIAHPPDWKVRALDGTRTDITDPATGSYLRVDWTATPGPSPEGAWKSLSQSFGARHQEYQELRIEPTTFKGLDAATWEYAYTAKGARLHAVNLGMVTDTHGFALNFQTPEDRWAGSQSQFEAFKASFQPPG